MSCTHCYSVECINETESCNQLNSVQQKYILKMHIDSYMLTSGLARGLWCHAAASKGKGKGSGFI